MSTYTYKVFETVVKESSFVKAANSLNLTPSAVSHAIAKLEDEFGFSLFIRSRTGVKLTGEGEKVLPLVCSVLRTEETLNQEVSRINGMESGLLRIGTFESVTLRWLPEIVNEFRKKYPAIEIALLEGICEDVVQWFKVSMVDVAFISGRYAKEIDIYPLHRDRLMCVTPPTFEPPNKEYVTVDDIKMFPILMQKEGDDYDTMMVLRKYGIDKRPAFIIDTDESMVAMAACGLGVGILPELFLSRDVKNVGIYPFNPTEYRTLGIALANEPTPSHAAKEFKKQVMEFVKKHGLYNIEEG